MNCIGPFSGSVSGLAWDCSWVVAETGCRRSTGRLGSSTTPKEEASELFDPFSPDFFSELAAGRFKVGGPESEGDDDGADEVEDDGGCEDAGVLSVDELPG